MAIQSVDRDAILRAITEFDATVRGSADWSHWAENKAQVWVIEHGGNNYPPKKIIAMATGQPVSSFSGGPESNQYLAERGFRIAKLRNPTLSETFALILERYSSARRGESFAGHHEIRDLFNQAREILEASNPVKGRPHLHVVASYGKGNWATIPWISLLDDRETKTTQQGTYVVYLFSADGAACHLKLGQGVTAVEKSFGSGAPDVLADRAAAIRVFCQGLAERGFDLSGRSDLGADRRLAKLYSASTAAEKRYLREHLPGDSELVADLEQLLTCYDQVVAARDKNAPPALDARPLALVGTWREVGLEVDKVREAIANVGAWASFWSFPVKDEARSRLVPPFNLYAYVGDGAIGARMRVDGIETSHGDDGIESPWPEATPKQWLGVRRVGPRKTDVCKTWVKIGDIEPLDPALQVSELEPAVGLSKPKSLLNQNSFGYVVDPYQTAQPPGTEPVSSIIPPTMSWLHEQTGLTETLLDEMAASVLGEFPQIVLSGPPGTSKTWVARKLATFLARGHAERVKFVQFHPGYSYESFVEGLRPVARTQGVSFELTPGVVRQCVGEMEKNGHLENLEHPYVIIIDEANRANLPRVLGELMFLFEYRNEAIALQYSGSFKLPSNLYFLATMNTADRSIRSIDVALRRRFDVFELGPDPAILGRFYDGKELLVPDLVEGFRALNLALATQIDRHHTIGHAFFMRPRLDPRVLSQIWDRRVFPLIEEFYFDQPGYAKEFTLGRFWPRSANVA